MAPFLLWYFLSTTSSVPWNRCYPQSERDWLISFYFSGYLKDKNKLVGVKLNKHRKYAVSFTGQYALYISCSWVVYAYLHYSNSAYAGRLQSTKIRWRIVVDWIFRKSRQKISFYCQETKEKGAVLVQLMIVGERFLRWTNTPLE